MGSITIKGAESISMFCRLLINEKKKLPIRSSEMGLLILAVEKREAGHTDYGRRVFQSIKADDHCNGPLVGAKEIFRKAAV